MRGVVAQDLTGRVFGRLTVIARNTSRRWEKPVWICQCDCGTLISVRAQSLRDGKSASCGCLRSELSKKRFERLRANG